MEELTRKIIGKAIEVHKQLGPGLLESTYETCLEYELRNSGFRVQKQVAMPIIYKDIKLEYGYRIDLLVENKIVLELKSVERLNDIHMAQILTYLKLGNYPLGYLINFNVLVLIKGLRRFINKTK